MDFGTLEKAKAALEAANKPATYVYVCPLCTQFIKDGAFSHISDCLTAKRSGGA